MQPKGKRGKDDDEDDPIAKSLNERIAAGGITSVVSKPTEKGTSISKVTTVVKATTNLKANINKKQKDGEDVEEEKIQSTPKGKDAKKITLPKPSGTNLIKKTTTKDDKDDDDPIA